MKKYLIGLASLFCLVLLAQAQQPKKAAKKVVYKGQTFMADGKTGNGKISKARFDELLDKALLVQDSAHVTRTVNYYVFMYAERGIFEDSTGKMRIMSDNYSLQCDNGRLPADWVKSIRERSKAGDTAYFNSVRASYDDSGKYNFYAEPLKLILTD